MSEIAAKSQRVMSPCSPKFTLVSFIFFFIDSRSPYIFSWSLCTVIYASLWASSCPSNERIIFCIFELAIKHDMIKYEWINDRDINVYLHMWSNSVFSYSFGLLVRKISMQFLNSMIDFTTSIAILLPKPNSILLLK